MLIILWVVTVSISITIQKCNIALFGPYRRMRPIVVLACRNTKTIPFPNHPSLRSNYGPIRIFTNTYLGVAVVDCELGTLSHYFDRYFVGRRGLIVRKDMGLCLQLLFIAATKFERTPLQWLLGQNSLRLAQLGEVKVQLAHHLDYISIFIIVINVIPQAQQSDLQGIPPTFISIILKLIQAVLR